MLSTGQWDRMLVARFSRPIGFDPDAWQLVLEDELGGSVSETEIVETLTWMQSRGQKWEPPKTVKALIVAIRTRRKAIRQANEPGGGVDGACGMCADGLVEYWPRATTGPWTLDALGGEYRTVGPCRCAAGRLQERFMPALTDAEWELARRQKASVREGLAGADTGG